VCAYRQRVLARIQGSKLVPMGDLGKKRVSVLDPARETVVICHHGNRSACVARALQRAGFARGLNLEGGVDAYSDVDAFVPRY
jgi:rhodanese-related sulfurtransferase